MGKGNRLIEGARLKEIALSVWATIKNYKKIFIPAGAGVFALILSLVLVLTLGGRGPAEDPGEEPEPSPVMQPSPEPPPPSPPPPPEPSPFVMPDGLNPLSGLPMDDESLRQNRPIAMMHNNFHQPGGRNSALPMYGISHADIIYEVISEGVTTRMMALYMDVSGIPKIGAVRSARLCFLELALAYDAILVHVGGSVHVIGNRSNPSMIRTWGMTTIDARFQPSSHFRRDYSDRPGVSSEHAMFTTGEHLLELAGKISPRDVPEGYDNNLRFNAEAPMPASRPAAIIKVPVYTNKNTWFHYNKDDSLYYIEQYGAPFIDGLTGEQVAVTNVLVIQTSITLIPRDPHGLHSVDLTSGGTGYYAAEGRTIPVKWSRESYNAPFVYTHENGDPLELLPGKTFVCIIPNNMTPEFMEPE
jgi:hypothetical protein